MLALDSDVMIDLLREYPPALLWIESVRTQKLFLAGFVVMELIRGCSNKAEQGRVEKKLSAFQIAWPSEASCYTALDLFAKYRLSHNLGMLDSLIGITALDLGVPLCTFNEKHYSVIAQLVTVQPYPRGPNRPVISN